MPGMMDTILNLGLNDDAVRGLAERTGNPRFANDSYRRLIQMYGEVVDGVDGHLFEEALSKLKERARRGARRRPVRRGPGRAGRDASRASTRARPAARSRRTRASSSRAPSAPSSSPGTTRARRSTGARTTSPTTSGRPSTSSRWSSATRATAREPASASRAIPSTGEAGLYGEFLADAQGEDVVAGIRTPEPLERMKESAARGVRAADRHDAAPRGALPRHAGHRVHGRGREALPAADAQREADGRGGARIRRRHGRRGPDLTRGRCHPHRPRPARPAAAPDDRSRGAASRSSRRA